MRKLRPCSRGLSRTAAYVGLCRYFSVRMYNFRTLAEIAAGCSEFPRTFEQLSTQTMRLSNPDYSENRQSSRREPGTNSRRGEISQ
jgi:hypothetical protein